MKKKKYVFISSAASPYQVKFCYSLQEYFDAEFWFYEHVGKHRPKWWKVPLGDKCKVMKLSGKLPFLGFFSFGLLGNLLKSKPDIIVLGGFMKWHWLVLKLVKLINKNTKVVIMTEPFWQKSQKLNHSNELLSKKNSPNKLALVKKMFNNVDLLLGMGKVAKEQLIKEFEFPGSKVELGQYPQDIEEHFKHPLRNKKKSDKFRLLFANRLIERYNPIFALEVFKTLKSRYENIEIYLNSEGPLKEECLNFINEHELESVYFLDEIDSWNNLHKVYRDSDILILPASYSNGNMSINEARASGAGIVISDQINDVYNKYGVNNEDLFICELSIDTFVNAISKYLEKPKLLYKHGLEGRKYVEWRKNKYRAKYYYDTLKKHMIVN